MAKMIPETISPAVKSNAEKKVFSWLREIMSGSMVIIHSLGIAEHIDKEFGEIDFVIISNQGVLCVEVKGGNVFFKDGEWHFVNRYGTDTVKKEGPYAQSQGNKHSLRNYVMKQTGPTDNLANCLYANCVITPDCFIKSYRNPEITSEITFDKSDTVGENSEQKPTGKIEDFIKKAFNYWNHQAMIKNGRERKGLSNSEIVRLTTLLRGTVGMVPSMGMQVKDIESELIRLTDEQMRFMRGVHVNKQILIEGAAGTGKTLLAREQCSTAAVAGKKVLYLCYNAVIASYVKWLLKNDDNPYDVYSLNQLMCEICGVTVPNDAEDFFWEEELPNQFISCMESYAEEKKYDLVVIDEGQDLMTSVYYICIDSLIKGGFKDGSWAMYYDRSQNICNKKC